MVNVAICGNIDFGGQSAADVLSQCARDLRMPEPAVHDCPSAFALLEHFGAPSANGLLDVVVLHAGQQGMSALQVVRDARTAGFEGSILLIENSSAHASEAWRLHVERFLVQPVSAEDFADEAKALLERAAAIDAESITLPVRGGIKRILFAQLVYAQTANHDQVLHFFDGSTAPLRCSSQDLFDKLSHDPRFLKLGSSYIVNLDFVKSLRGNGATALFTDGTTASVPVRFRKTMQTALIDHAKREIASIQEGSVAHA